MLEDREVWLLANPCPRLLPGGSALVVGEAFATLAEAAVYLALVREPGRALVASAVANAASFGVGLVVFG